ncbi:mechanosensitive ion channel family protein [Patescibacteria group bacterium]|nr:mechanosensitive ion channel family protein [Patescibacteria group bacterium]
MDYDTWISWLQVSGLKIAIIIVAGIIAQIVVASVTKKLLTSILAKHITGKRSSAGRQKRIDTLHQVFTKTFGVIIFLVVLLMVFVELGINVTPILTGAGIVGIAVGFGAQDIVKNLFHGIFILLEDQYSEGDVVSVAGISGVVEDFDLRRTVLRDLDGVQHHIPNGEILVASNKTKGWSGINWDVGVGYGTDLKKLKEIINRTGEKLKSDHDEVVEAPTLAGVEEFADSAIVVKVLGKVQPGQQWAMAREFKKMVKEAFDRENIEIPFPHQVEIRKSIE